MTIVPVLRTRRSVRFAQIAPGGFRLLAALDGATKTMGRDLEITCGTDSHTSGRHPDGEAYDVSVTGLTVAEIARLRSHLQVTLGKRFTVLYEVPVSPTDPAEAAIAYVNPKATGKHLHLQVRRVTAYPPPGNVAYG